VNLGHVRAGPPRPHRADRARAGGHQYRIRGYDAEADELIGRCWSGTFRDFRISREHLNELLLDDGDAHVQERTA